VAPFVRPWPGKEELANVEKATTCFQRHGGGYQRLLVTLLSSAGISTKRGKVLLRNLHPGELLLAGVGVEEIRAATFKRKVCLYGKGGTESTAKWCPSTGKIAIRKY